ncbi:MAG TPA: hypothetical protein VHL79_01135 [Ramlibacter sp.]|nr:hypothetical protein [Ramlibacter sp.]
MNAARTFTFSASPSLSALRSSAVAPEPSLREELAMRGIENTGEERKRKRREAKARRLAARAAASPAPP